MHQLSHSCAFVGQKIVYSQPSTCTSALEFSIFVWMALHLTFACLFLRVLYFGHRRSMFVSTTSLWPPCLREPCLLCWFILFYRQIYTPANYHHHLQGDILRVVKSNANNASTWPHLGVWITPTLNWPTQISDLGTKGWAACLQPYKAARPYCSSI